MTDIHAHLKKLRSDAAECLVLSSLAPDGKGAIFTRVAEHLNALALDLEKSTITQSNSVSAQKPEGDPAVNVVQIETTLRPRRISVRLGVLFAAIFVLGMLVGMTSLSTSAAHYWSSMVPNVGQSVSDETSAGAVNAALNSAEQSGGKIVSEQVAALGNRLNEFDNKLTNLEKVTTEISQGAATVNSDAKAFGGRLDQFDHKLDGLERATAEITRLLSTATLGPEAKGFATEGNAAPVIGKPVSTAEAGMAYDEPPLQAKPTDSVGPLGCKQFRSFDPKSGTYVTLDRRRRPCR